MSRFSGNISQLNNIFGRSQLEIKEQIRTFILKNILLGSSEKPLGDNDSFLDQGLIDSTGILELVGFVEDEFDIEVEDSDLIPENFDSVSKLTVYVQSRIEGSTP
jgi:acyl carrier protein